jgi:hypothetical protein
MLIQHLRFRHNKIARGCNGQWLDRTVTNILELREVEPRACCSGWARAPGIKAMRSEQRGAIGIRMIATIRRSYVL